MKSNMLANVGRTISKVGFKMKKHSPEILVVAGVVGTVVSTVMACKATTKLDAVLENAKFEMDAVKKAAEKGEVEIRNEETQEVELVEYTEQDYKKDLAITVAKNGLSVAKLYAPSVVLGVASITCILASNNILRKRSAAIAAAYATIEKSFGTYRKNVVDRFGAEVDKQLKYNLKATEVEEVVTDENGKESTVKKAVYVVNPGDISGYARFFERYTTDKDGEVVRNPNWEPNNEYNLMFIKAQERHANDLLKAKGFLFLNDVYEMLGLPVSKEGQIVGWVYDKDKECEGDGFVSFGLYNDNLSYSDYVNGYDPAILLDFNVDGDIWSKM